MIIAEVKGIENIGRNIWRFYTYFYGGQKHIAARIGQYAKDYAEWNFHKRYGYVRDEYSSAGHKKIEESYDYNTEVHVPNFVQIPVAICQVIKNNLNIKTVHIQATAVSSSLFSITVLNTAPHAKYVEFGTGDAGSGYIVSPSFKPMVFVIRPLRLIRGPELNIENKGVAKRIRQKKKVLYKKRGGFIRKYVVKGQEPQPVLSMLQSEHFTSKLFQFVAEQEKEVFNSIKLEHAK